MEPTVKLKADAEAGCRELLGEARSAIGKPEAKPPRDKLSRYVRVIKTLSNATRLEILWLLSRYEVPVCVLSTVINKEQSLVSHHLRELRDAGLVKERQRGRLKFYVVDRRRLLEVAEMLRELAGG